MFFSHLLGLPRNPMYQIAQPHPRVQKGPTGTEMWVLTPCFAAAKGFLQLHAHLTAPRSHRSCSRIIKMNANCPHCSLPKRKSISSSGGATTVQTTTEFPPAAQSLPFPDTQGCISGTKQWLMLQFPHRPQHPRPLPSP